METLNDKDQRALNRLETTQAQLEYTIKAIKRDNTTKHSKPMIESIIQNIDRAKKIIHEEEY